MKTPNARTETGRTRVVAVLIFASLWLASLLVSVQVNAQARTEDELMRAEIIEARSRASDFKVYLETVLRREEQAMKGAEEVKLERAKLAAEQEQRRLEYIRDRNSRPTDEQAEARFDQLDAEMKARAAAEMERYRQAYLEKRRRVRNTIENDEQINEMKEYGL